MPALLLGLALAARADDAPSRYRSSPVRVADRYVLSPSMRLRAPKEPDGTIAMSRQAWLRLFGSLGLTNTGG